MSFQVPPVPGSWTVPQCSVLCTLILPGENCCAGRDLTPGFGGETYIFSLATEQAVTSRSTGVVEQQGQGPSGLHLHAAAGLSYSTLLQGKASYSVC